MVKRVQHLTYSISQRTEKLLAAAVSSVATSGKLWMLESKTLTAIGF